MSQRARHDWSDIAAGAAILSARITLFLTWTLVNLQNKNQIPWFQLLGSFSQSFRLLYPQLDTGPLSCRSQGSLMAGLTTYHDLCCHPLHNVAHAVFLENAWQNTFTPRAGSVKKREDELSLSLQMEDWKLDAVLIYVCFTHSLLKFFPPFVINKIYIVCVFSVASVVSDSLRPYGL